MWEDYTSYIIYVLVGVFVLASILSLYTKEVANEPFTIQTNYISDKDDASATNISYRDYYNNQYPSLTKVDDKCIRDADTLSDFDLQRILLEKEKKSNFVYPKHIDRGDDKKMQRVAEKIVKATMDPFDKEMIMKQIEDRKHAKASSKLPEFVKSPDALPSPNPDIPSPYGYVYMPNRLWRSNQYQAPVCYSNTTNIVQPVFTNGLTSDILEFTGVGSILPTFEYRETPGSLDEKSFFNKLTKDSMNIWATDSRVHP